MAKINVTHVSVSSLGKLVGSLNAIIAVAIGVVAAIVGTVGVIANADQSVLADVFTALGITLVGIIVYPLVGFAFGWVYGALLGLVWNAVLGVSGGLEIETEAVEEPVAKK